MEFYANDTVATKYFQEDTFVLRGKRFQDPETRVWTFDETTLILRFNFFGGDVTLNVFDDATKVYTHELNSTSATGITKFLKTVEADYDKKIPAKFYKLPVEFLALADKGFSVDVDLENEPNWDYRHCDQCGDMNSNQLFAFYFPAINEKNPATFAVGWEYGCYGGEKISFNDRQAYELLERARENAEIIAAVELDEFIANLEKVGIVKSS